MASTSSTDQIVYTFESVEFGEGEGSFFGLRLNQGTKYDVTLKANMCLSSFALDPTTMGEDEHVTLWIKTDEEFALCSLTRKFPQYHAKFYFCKREPIHPLLEGTRYGVCLRLQNSSCSV